MPYSLVDNGVDEDNNSIAGKLKLAQLAGLTPPGLDLMRGLDPMGNNIANPQLQIPNQGIGMPSMPKLPDYEPTRDAPSPGPQPDLRSANSGAPSPTNKFDFKKLFLGSHEPSGVDEYGLTKPGSSKIGLLGALLGSLPATLYGASQGLGLTGLGVGLGAAGKQNMQQDEQASKDYQTNRAMAQKVDYENKSLAQQAANAKATQDLAKASLENTKNYQGQTLGLAGRKLDVLENKDQNKISDKEKDKADALSYAGKAVQGLSDALEKIPSLGGNVGNLYAQGVNAAQFGNSKYAEPMADIDFYGNILAGDISKQLFSRNTQFEFQKVLKDVIASKHGSLTERRRKIKLLQDFVQTKADLLNNRSNSSSSIPHSLEDIDAAIQAAGGTD